MNRETKIFDKGVVSSYSMRLFIYQPPLVAGKSHPGFTRKKIPKLKMILKAPGPELTFYFLPFFD
jgi:hypothetical protein